MLAGAERVFSNKRIARRVEELASSIIEKESVVIHRLAKDEAQQRSFYRLLHNANLTTEQVVSFMQQDCLRQLEPGLHYLVIHDTTQPNFERNRSNISNFGELGVIVNNASLGFFLHASLVVEAQRGRCTGFSNVITWSRQASAPSKQERNYKKQPIAEKESYRWLRSCQTSSELLEKAGRLTHICDREGDIGELFLQLPDQQRVHLLVRSSADRCLADGSKLTALLSGLPEQGRHRLELKGDVRTGRQQRTAQLAVRYSKVELQLGKEQKELYVVEAREEQPPATQKPVYWRLLTTHPVENLEAALQVLAWYNQRWNIEQVFRLLKQKGLNVEALELENGKALVQLTLLGLYAVSKIMLLHIASKQKEPVPVAKTFTLEQLQCLKAINKDYEGKTEKQKNPYPPDTLQWCYWVLARLGGWKPHEKQAGVITLQRGFMDFHKIFDGWSLALKFVS